MLLSERIGFRTSTRSVNSFVPCCTKRIFAKKANASAELSHVITRLYILNQPFSGTNPVSSVRKSARLLTVWSWVRSPHRVLFFAMHTAYMYMQHVALELRVES